MLLCVGEGGCSHEHPIRGKLLSPPPVVQISFRFSIPVRGNTRHTSEQAAYLIVRDFHTADGKRRLEVGKAQKWRPRAAGNELKK